MKTKKAPPFIPIVLIYIRIGRREVPELSNREKFERKATGIPHPVCKTSISVYPWLKNIKNTTTAEAEITTYSIITKNTFTNLKTRTYEK
ncbi:hypothetical protein [Sinomicrobium sp. M5D2P17]